MNEITKEQIKTKNIIAIIAGVVLILAIPPLWPYGYYQLLRWVVTAAALYIIYISYGLDNKKWIWLMAIIAILFNPIFSIHLTKGIWAPIDFVVAIIFFISLNIKVGDISDNT
jgi:hypothetical protein